MLRNDTTIKYLLLSLPILGASILFACEPKSHRSSNETEGVISTPAKQEEDYWTKEKMKDAQPYMPALPGEPKPPPEELPGDEPGAEPGDTDQNTDEGSISAPAKQEEGYWTPERMKDAQPYMPALPGEPKKWPLEELPEDEPGVMPGDSGEAEEGAGSSRE